MKKIPTVINHWVKIVPLNLHQFILKNASTKIKNRYIMATQHYEKAYLIKDLDPEMAIIRLIAAEEELVVAIFKILETLKHLGSQQLIFAKSSKNHQVKLAFSQVLFVFKDILKNYFNPELGGQLISEVKTNCTAHNNSSPSFFFKLELENDRFDLKIVFLDTKKECSVFPNDFEITLPPGKDVTLSLYQTFLEHVPDNDLKAFLGSRANFRNKIFYSEDVGAYSMSQTWDKFISIFNTAIGDLAWSIGLLIDPNTSIKKWLLISQFLEVFQNILIECKFIKKK